MTANMSAATPVLLGSTRLSIAAVATAASIALPPFIMICRPACAASGWLVVTTPWVAMISERPWAAQPSARSPRTAAHAAAFGSVSQTDTAGRPCGQAAVAIEAIAMSARLLLMRMVTGRLQVSFPALTELNYSLSLERDSSRFVPNELLAGLPDDP